MTCVVTVGVTGAGDDWALAKVMIIEYSGPEGCEEGALALVAVPTHKSRVKMVR